MRKQKRNALRNLSIAREQGVVTQCYRMAEPEPMPRTNGEYQAELIRATQKRKGSSQVPAGWRTMNPHFN